ncbi:MAG: winged helix-turn-helix transcriptional regulator [Candidatus Rokubacteria bacterium]|nr:winged helix-turn-helix transcriptional regulator [Candidatus Rokubacteria bacterium]
MNHRRLDALRLLIRTPDVSAADLADALGLSLPAAGMQLLRLTRSGLASRLSDRRHSSHCYAITPKGRARLEFLQGGGR